MASGDVHLDFVTKDSGERAEYASGMVRDSQDGKARFDLIMAEGVPYDAQFLTRVAQLMTRGIEKYGSRNWEKADSAEEIARFRGSAFRHLMQWYCGERDEDHAAAVVFNLLAAEMTEFKMQRQAKAEAVISPPDDAVIFKWVTDNPREFERWILRYSRIHGGRMPGR